MAVVFTVVNDWVLMLRDEVRETEGGILIPETCESELACARGECIAVGDGILVENGERAPMLGVAGRDYEYLTYTAKKVNVSGKEYDLVRDRDLIGFYGE